MRLRRGDGVWSYFLAAGLLGALAACGGGGGGGGVTTSSTPPPTPPPPVVVAQGQGFPLTAGFTGRVPFTTTRTGLLEATVDWTFAANDVDVLLARGDCSFEQLEAAQCPILAFSISTTAKPERIRFDGAAAGPYTLFVENTGATNESVSFQVVLTPSATASAAGLPDGGLSFQFKTPPRGYVELR